MYWRHLSMLRDLFYLKGSIPYRFFVSCNGNRVRGTIFGLNVASDAFLRSAL